MEKSPEKKEIEQKKRVAISTMGCRLNFSESGSIAQGFTDRGYEIVPFGDEAEVVFLNTCTVTDGADSTCRNLIRKAHRSSPEGKLVVAGCYAQMESKVIAEMKGVDLILGTSEKYKVFEYLNEEKDLQVKVDKTNEFWGAATTPSDGHTRSFLKIQDGCNYACSYCVIPQARGRSRATSIEDAVKQARELIANGFKEIVLTGVNIGEYESASGEKLTEMLRQLLALDGLKRLRMSSVEPNTITDELLEVLKASPKFLDHFHIPLQSGDDEILSSMKRKYTVDEYRAIINKILEKFPNAGIGADTIVGYPGEGEEQFNKTYALLKELPITHFHVFPFSKRRGTIAAGMEDQVHHATKKERVNALNLLGDAKLRMFSEDQVGSTNKVLFERRNKNGLYEGYTSNYVKVVIDTTSELKNEIREVYLSEFRDGQLHGELIQ